MTFIWIKFSIQRNEFDVCIVTLPAQKQKKNILSVVVEIYANIV